MPQQQYPPFSSDTGGSMNPRQLNRWIDKSPQGGPLKRTQGYVPLPTFDQAVTWRGYSEIIVAFNFASPNNFVLPVLTDLPSDGNYVLCIAYQKNGIVYRYKLCGPDGVFYFQLNNYNGEKILANFRLEVWSTQDANVSEATERKLWSSVHGQFDYRFADDFVLKSVDTTITDFQSANPAGAVPYTDYLAFQLRADTGFDSSGVAFWTSMDGAFVTLNRTGASNGSAHVESGINNQYTVTMTSVQGMEGTFAAPIAATNFFIVLKSPLSGVSGSVIKFYYASAMYGELTFSSTSGGGAGTATCTLDTGFATLTRKFSDGYYLIEVADGYVVIYYLADGTVDAQPIAILNSFNLGQTDELRICANRGMNIADIICYKDVNQFTTPAAYTPLFKYVSDRYSSGMMLMPFTFPTNSSVPTN